MSVTSNLTDRLGRWLKHVATYDVFPEFSARVRRLLYNPLGVLVLAALVALLCGAALHGYCFVLAGGLLTVIVLGVTWPLLSLRGMHGTLSFERARASEGERVEARLTLRNRWPWAVCGLAVRGGLGDESGAIHVGTAPGWRTLCCPWEFVPPRRGVYPLAASFVTTGFPFGLWESRRRLTAATPLVVWPRTLPVGPVPEAGGDQQVEGCVSRNKVGSNGDVVGVRPYRRGDSPRRIHWGQSARHDRLIVCELQANARPVIQLVLNADPQSHLGQGPDSSREWAVRVAASLTKGWLHAGAQVGAVWSGDVIPAAAGTRQLHRLLDGLAALPDAAGPSLGELLASPPCRNLDNGLQVVITTDRAVVPAVAARPVAEWRRWIVLHAAGFGGIPSPRATPTPVLAVRPWLWIDSPERVPACLRGGWKEARHGS
jgi:uncharacterized protein (DUF58 family)